jgi:Family of unknown function (DUF6636)
MRRISLASLGVLAAAALLLPGSAPAGGVKFFQTLDGNIGCAVIKGVKKRRHKHPRLPGQARCDVKAHSWSPPPRPKWCDLDWGFGVEVGEKRSGRYVCAGDSVGSVPKAPTLAPGATVKKGRFTCAILPAGVRCTNRVNGHGFEVSAIDVSLF